MQATSLTDNVHARSNRQMVRVAEEDLGAHLQQLAVVQGLDAGLSADRHEDRSLYDAMRRVQAAQPRPRRGILGKEFEHAADFARKPLHWIVVSRSWSNLSVFFQHWRQRVRG